MVFQLTDKLAFPDPHYGDPDGLLAVGGDLSIDRLILAYSNGIFPWYAFREELIQWWCPMDRFVIFPDEIHISHSMRTLINKGKYEITFNEAFEDVIQTCGELRMEQEGAWLGKKMMEAYTHLHEQGLAASVEVWEGEQLVGGLYGVTLGRCFFGESMFSLVPSASKLALIHLAQFFREHGGVMIDCQFETPHLKTMGGRPLSYDEYMNTSNKTTASKNNIERKICSTNGRYKRKVVSLQHHVAPFYYSHNRHSASGKVHLSFLLYSTPVMYIGSQRSTKLSYPANCMEGRIAPRQNVRGADCTDRAWRNRIFSRILRHIGRKEPTLLFCSSRI